MNKKGFTLIELLVVIAIIGLLSTLAVVALGQARVKARDSKRLSDLKQIQTALELFYTDVGSYPLTSTPKLGEGSAVCLNSSGFLATGCNSPYMGIVPKDPGSNSYDYTGGTTTYSISASLEGEMGGYKGTINLTPSGLIQK